MLRSSTLALFIVTALAAQACLKRSDHSKSGFLPLGLGPKDYGEPPPEPMPLGAGFSWSSGTSALSSATACAYGTSGNAGMGWNPLAPSLTEHGAISQAECRMKSAIYGNTKACVERSDIIVFKYKYWWTETPSSNTIHGQFVDVDMVCGMSINQQLSHMIDVVLPNQNAPSIDCASQPAGKAIGSATWEELGVENVKVRNRNECETFAIDRARVKACVDRNNTEAYLPKAWFVDPATGLDSTTFPLVECGAAHCFIQAAGVFNYTTYSAWGELGSEYRFGVGSAQGCKDAALAFGLQRCQSALGSGGTYNAQYWYRDGSGSLSNENSTDLVCN